ncbi:MAG: DNA-binding protein WhiA [Clostridiales bacterium]|nr:DNA-binding protein WhiA [Clostridiales bacterium]
MSFASDTKQELCKISIGKKCCSLAEAYGILLYCNTFTDKEIKVVTENKALVQRLPKLFEKVFTLSFDQKPEDNEPEGKKAFVIFDTKKIAKILQSFGYDTKKVYAHHVNFAILEDDCCKASFIRGAFLAGGSVTDPAKRYHLELVTDHYNVNKETYSVLVELGFEAKNASRNGNYMAYFKQSEAIEDLLTTMGAPLAAMAVMNAKVEKDMRNSINRRVNCDTANLEKMVNASIEQVEAIRKLEASGSFENLTEKLKETARLRLSNPEASIAELAAMSDPPVTKSCLNHRLRKIVKLSDRKSDKT